MEQGQLLNKIHDLWKYFKNKVGSTIRQIQTFNEAAETKFSEGCCPLDAFAQGLLHYISGVRIYM